MDSRTGDAVTVSVTAVGELETVPTVAVMLVVPAATPVANPLLLMVAV